MIIKLNVGGVKYYTTKETLENEDGFLKTLMKNDFDNVNEDGYYFIDRNGHIFKYILEYLRNLTVNRFLPEDILFDLFIESEFYCLTNLTSMIYQLLDKNIVVASILPSNNDFGAQYYFCHNQEWPEDLPMEQKAYGTQQNMAKSIDEYDPESSQKISLYYLRKGYTILDTFEKLESFKSCSMKSHGPIEDSHCTHSHTTTITRPRKYHILQKK